MVLAPFVENSTSLVIEVRVGDAVGVAAKD
jgi:hypothetical protein